MLGAVGPGRRLWPFGGHGSVAGAAGAGLPRRLPGRLPDQPRAWGRGRRSRYSARPGLLA